MSRKVIALVYRVKNEPLAAINYFEPGINFRSTMKSSIFIVKSGLWKSSDLTSLLLQNHTLLSPLLIYELCLWAPACNFYRPRSMIEDNDEHKIDHLTKFLNFSLFPCLYITDLFIYLKKFSNYLFSEILSYSDENTNLEMYRPKQSLQNLWPHLVRTGSRKVDWQMEHCKSSSTRETNTSS